MRGLPDEHDDAEARHRAAPARDGPRDRAGRRDLIPRGRLWPLAYNGLLLPAARLAIAGLARWNPKLARGIEARRGIEERWREAALRLDGRTPRIWLHAASAGETLQARPLGDAIRAAHPEAALFYSFFSPSAERIATSWRAPDHADYLPFDWPAAMESQIDTLTPDALVLVAGELWPNLVWKAAARGVPLAQACARLAGGSARFDRKARALTGRLYREFAAIGAVTEEDAALIRSLGVFAEAVRVTGDTRVDATVARVEAAADLPSPWRASAGEGPVVVAGSTWPADEAVVLESLARLRPEHPGLVALVAPHEPASAAVRRIAAAARSLGLGAARIETAGEGGDASGAGATIRIVDRVGILYRLYAGAQAAYVGGGFGGAVHNTMEPAAQGVPIAIGPRHGGPAEVGLLSAAGGLAVVRSATELAGRWSAWLSDPAAGRAAGDAARSALEGSRGATDRTLAFFRERGLPV